MSRNTGSPVFGVTEDTTNAEIDSLDVHGEDHDLSEAHEGNRTQCMFCFALQLWLVEFIDGGKKEIPLDPCQFFHEECSTCKPVDDSETQLCDFCRHIRLRHILRCRSKLRASLFRSNGSVGLIVDMRGLESMRNRQNCGLCRLAADTVSIHGPEAPEVNRSSTPDFVKLKIFLNKSMHPRVLIMSNLLKREVEISIKDLRLRASTPDKPEVQRFFPKPSGEEISWDRIRELLPDFNPSPIGRLPSHFRLIDVLERRCVTVGPSFDGTFVALSYVWGSARGVGQAWSAADLHNPPHTIADALHACHYLGQKYLWVDQICINQDDPTDKANQIASMAAIYSSASLVIVAARGESVHSGLSGMSLARGRLRARQSFLDLEFASVPDFYRDISGSIWSTRGWTLQEVALNKIKLYFSSPGVWLDYKKNETEVTQAIDFDRVKGTSYEPDVGSTFRKFSDHLREYTSRKLTYDSDIYNAFSGIMTALFGGPDTDIYGLPEQHFDSALLWATSQDGHPPSIRIFRNNRDPALNPLLPTWSWASVTGKVKITGTGNYGDVVPIVKWARIAPNSQPPTPTLIRSQIEEFGLGWAGWSKFTFLPAVLWSYSCLDSPSPFAPLQPDDHTETRRKELMPRWPSPRYFWHEVSSGGSRSPAYPGLDIPGLTGQDDSIIAQLQPGVLLTRAQSAHVWVDADGYIRDGDHGALIGRLYGGDRGIIPRKDSPKTGVFECVAISLATAPYGMHDFIEKKCQELGETQKATWSDGNSCDFEFTQARDKPVVNVMLIGREGQFSYRLGVGWIIFHRWIDAERVFETILLK